MQNDQLANLLSVGVKNGASDVHFRPGDAPMYRVNGVLHPFGEAKLTPAHTELIATSLLGERVRTMNEADGPYSIPGVARFRVNVYRQRGTFAVILRIIPAEVPTLESLSLPPVLSKIASGDRGLVLVTGATGSGKTSTLAAMINHINKTTRKHILTIEDPIEFIHENIHSSISQREIGVDTDNFKGALRSALRQDPDVILVGEMRDVETIDTAIKAAETGHLVFSTVHTVDCASTVSRLISVFPPSEQMAVRLRLADALMATISQRLLVRADRKGRVLAQEIMMSTVNVQEHIRDALKTSGIKEVLGKNRDEGMQTFDQHITDLYRENIIDLAVAKAAATNASDFERALNFG